jgi:hypothetical protein
MTGQVVDEHYLEKTHEYYCLTDNHLVDRTKCSTVTRDVRPIADPLKCTRKQFHN